MNDKVRINIDEIQTIDDFNIIVYANILKGIYKYELYSESGRPILDIPNSIYCKLDDGDDK